MKAYHLMGKAPYYTNCFMLTDNKGCAVLIDCSADIEKIKAILENDRCRLSAILLTHGHQDHRETLDQTVAEFDCPVYLGEEDAAQFGLENTIAYEDLGNLLFGEIRLHTFHTPGHTPGGYCLMCENMLFCGDTLFAGTVGRTDFPGGSFEVLKESLARIVSKVPDEMQVLPGHNHFSTMKQEKEQNPYLRRL